MGANIISIINLKGGVGKSTLTMMIGEYLAFRYAKNVLLIDMDAQANLSFCMLSENRIETQEREGRTCYHLFRNALRGDSLDIREFITQPPLVVSNVARSGMNRYGTDIHMVVSTPSVAQLDEELLNLWEQNKPMPQNIRQVITEALLPVIDHYDYILVDCPPGLSLFSSAALIASDFYVAPIIPEPLSLQGVSLVQQRETQLKERYGATVEFKGVILNIVKHYRSTHNNISNYLYTDGTSSYQPFKYWLPDNERIRKLGEFDPDISSGDWAMGIETKFSNLHHKYSLSYRLTNPKLGQLSRQDEEGINYRLEDRIAHLVDEFQEKCTIR